MKETEDNTMVKDKFKMNKAVYMVLAGLILLAADIKLSTGVEYGFVIGNGEGVKRFAITQLVMSYVGMELRIDVLPDVIGYILAAAGMRLLGKGRQSKKVAVLAVIGSAANVVQIILPMYISITKLAVPVIALFLVQVLCETAIMYAFVAKCTANIDNYKYMQVRKDLKFASELYGICLITANILLLFSKTGWYFARTLYILVSVLAVADMIYFEVKSTGYIYELRLFEKTGTELIK